MAITPNDVRQRFPEFDCVSKDKIQLYIDDATLELNESFWGDRYNLGLLYLTAHFLKIDERNRNGNTGSVNPIASRAVDGTSVSYTTLTAKDQAEAYYMSTSYGQRYLAMLKRLGIAACVV